MTTKREQRARAADIEAFGKHIIEEIEKVCDRTEAVMNAMTKPKKKPKKKPRGGRK